MAKRIIQVEEKSTRKSADTIKYSTHVRNVWSQCISTILIRY